MFVNFLFQIKDSENTKNLFLLAFFQFYLLAKVQGNRELNFFLVLT